METIYYSATETAKLIRKELKQVFPWLKFSVKKTGYNSIRVTFTGTPDEGHMVNLLVRQYRGCDFDGMTDSKNYIRHEKDGKRISYGADFIFVDLELAA